MRNNIVTPAIAITACVIINMFKRVYRKNSSMYQSHIKFKCKIVNKANLNRTPFCAFCANGSCLELLARDHVYCSMIMICEYAMYGILLYSMLYGHMFYMVTQYHL